MHLKDLFYSFNVSGKLQNGAERDLCNSAQMSNLNGGLLTGIQRDEVILSAIQHMRAENTDTRKMPPEFFKL